MGTPMIAGNWKMNKGEEDLAKNVAQGTEDRKNNNNGKYIDVVMLPPLTSLGSVIAQVKGKPVSVGVQNFHQKDKGAYTGEVSLSMIKEFAPEVKYAIIGHSERRAMFGETDELVNLKTKKALEMGIIPIVCVGETKEQRDAGKTDEVVSNQVTAALKDIKQEDISKVVIAYEPVWAIGKKATGKCNPEEADRVCKLVRSTVSNVAGSEQAGKDITVLYGGSVSEKNADQYASMPNIDGPLVGGAALKSERFLAIADAFNAKKNG